MRKPLVIPTLFFLLAFLALFTPIAYADVSQAGSLLLSGYNANTAWMRTCESDRYIVFLGHDSSNFYIRVFDKSINNFTIQRTQSIGSPIAVLRASCVINGTVAYIVADRYGQSTTYTTTRNVFMLNLVSNVLTTLMTSSSYSYATYNPQASAPGIGIGGNIAVFNLRAEKIDTSDISSIGVYNFATNQFTRYDISGSWTDSEIIYDQQTNAFYMVERSTSSPFTISYYLLTTTSLTLLANHPVDNDFMIADVRDFYIKYSDGYYYMVLIAVQPRVINNVRDYKIVVHKLVFNGTISPSTLVGQYRAVATLSPNLPSGSTPAWAIFSRLSDQSFIVRTPVLINNQYKVYRTLYTVENLFTNGQHSIVLTSGQVDEDYLWAGWNYYVDSYVYKNQWSDYMIEVLRSSGQALIYRGAPRVWTISVQDNTVWRNYDTLPYNIPLTVNLTVLDQFGWGVDGAQLMVFVNGQYAGGNYSRGPNGVAYTTITLPQAQSATITYRVLYNGATAYEFSKTYNLRAGNWTVRFILVPPEEYNPQRTDYNFDNDVSLIDVDKGYIIVMQALAEGVPSPCTFKVYLWSGNSYNFLTELTNTTYPYLAKMGLSVTMSTVRLKVEAYYNNVKVAELEKTYPTNYNPAPPTVPEGGVSATTIQGLVNMFPALVVIMFPPVIFYSVMKSKISLLLGFGVGIIVATLAGLIPMYIIIFAALLVVLYFVYGKGESE